jgi:hypothetical protein
MKDVLTFIFGQISGDVEGQELYEERDENSYEVDGDMKLTDFNNLSNFGIEDPRMTTIGGVAFRHLDRLPQVGDSISIEDITITVLEMDVHRIARVRVSRGTRVDEAAGGDMPAEAATSEAAADEVPDGESDSGRPAGGAVQPDADTDVADARRSRDDGAGPGRKVVR